MTNHDPRLSPIIGDGCSRAEEVVRALQITEFPIEWLRTYPVSAIENMAVELAGVPRGVCAVGCLGCCAGAIPPTMPGGRIARLSPKLLSRILLVAEELVKQDLHILSTVRLALYNGSNELDNLDCIALRRVLSGFFERIYGFPLGSISSDLVFHISGSPALEWNLSQVLEKPKLWDNICFSVDEQIPVRDEAEYRRYLEKLGRIWTILKPALKCQLDHARAARLGAPRVVINMLVPQDGAQFRNKHQCLYPGGPRRAVRFEELVDRYIKPFVGSPIETTGGLPTGHKFTSGVARLSEVPGSSVYVGYNHYMPTGRGGALVRFANGRRKVSPGAINTKIYPAGEGRFRFKAYFTTVPFADDEVPVPADQRPPWFWKLNSIVIDVGRLYASDHSRLMAALRD